jgi:hypothetical protein
MTDGLAQCSVCSSRATQMLFSLEDQRLSTGKWLMELLQPVKDGS